MGRNKQSHNDVQMGESQRAGAAAICVERVLTFSLLFKGCGMEVESPQRSEDLERTARTAVAQRTESGKRQKKPFSKNEMRCPRPFVNSLINGGMSSVYSFGLKPGCVQLFLSRSFELSCRHHLLRRVADPKRGQI